MSKKQEFVKEIGKFIEDGIIALGSDALDYFNGLQMTGDNDKPKFTQNGKLILKYMQENKDNYNNLFKAKDMGEGMGVSSRTVSGGMHKLVTDGYVEKIGEQPTVYSLTSLGTEVDLNAE